MSKPFQTFAKLWQARLRAFDVPVLGPHGTTWSYLTPPSPCLAVDACAGRHAFGPALPDLCFSLLSLSLVLSSSPERRPRTPTHILTGVNGGQEKARRDPGPVPSRLECAPGGAFALVLPRGLWPWHTPPDPTPSKTTPLQTHAPELLSNSSLRVGAAAAYARAHGASVALMPLHHALQHLFLVPCPL
jgi:hypothetical protein